MALPDDLNNGSHQEEDLSINIKKLFLYYLSYWKWFALSLVCFLLLGGVYLFTTAPQYEIKASILIKDSKTMGGGATSSILEEFDFFSSKKVVENEIEILNSFTLLEQVAKDLNLQVSYWQRKGLKTIPLYDVPIKVEVIAADETLYETPLSIRFDTPGTITVNEKTYPPHTPVSETFGVLKITTNDSLLAAWEGEKTIDVHIAPLNTVVESLHENLSIQTSAKGTSVLNLSMLSSVPKKGEDIINHLIVVYNKAAIADKNYLIGTTLDFIDERLDSLSKSLEAAEKDVQNYKSSQGITDISTEAQLFLQSVQKNDIDRSQTEIQLSVLKNIEEYVQFKGSGNGVAPATLGLSDPTLLSLIASLSSAEAERIKALQTVGLENPLLRAYDQQIAELKKSIAGNIHTLRRSLEITQLKLNNENRRLEALIQSIPQKERELVDITRQQEIKNQLYIFLLSKREESAISYASTVSDSRLIDAARSSAYPVKPVKKLVILAFAFLGMLIPVIVLWVRNIFYDKISTKEEIEESLKAPIVGEISLLQQAVKVIAMSKNRSVHAEQIRTLRSNLEFMAAGSKLTTLMVTSSISGEGKSFLTANLGATLASANKRAVILGFDLRKPGLHKTVGIDNNEGLSNYLAGQATLKDIIHPVPQVENLDIITCGHVPPNPQELLLSDMLSQLMEELKAHYNYIIIDTPPVGLVSDAHILNRFVDVSIYVIRQHYTPKDRLTYINDLYGQKQLHNLCVVVNSIDEKKWHGYRYSSYGTKKYYGHYYEEQQNR